MTKWKHGKPDDHAAGTGHNHSDGDSGDLYSTFYSYADAGYYDTSQFVGLGFPVDKGARQE